MWLWFIHWFLGPLVFFLVVIPVLRSLIQWSVTLFFCKRVDASNLRHNVADLDWHLKRQMDLLHLGRCECVLNRGSCASPPTLLPPLSQTSSFQRQCVTVEMGSFALVSCKWRVKGGPPSVRSFTNGSQSKSNRISTQPNHSKAWIYRWDHLRQYLSDRQRSLFQSPRRHVHCTAHRYLLAKGRCQR